MLANMNMNMGGLVRTTDYLPKVTDLLTRQGIEEHGMGKTYAKTFQKGTSDYHDYHPVS